MKKPVVSVISPNYNNAKYIEKFVASILSQSFKDFELLVVDDCSTDDTIARLKKIKDKRLKVLKTPANGDISVARNLGMKHAKGKYIFFTDGDCTADKNWLAKGVETFEKEQCLGVEGKLQYVSKNYKPGFMDNVAENPSGGRYMGANVAYTKKVVDEVGFFDTAMRRMEDRDFALRVLQKGKIVFAKDMVVTHQKYPWTFKKKMKLAREDTKGNITLFKRFKDKNQIFGRIYQPVNLLALFFPPLVLGVLFTKKFNKISDLKVLSWTYAFVVVERFTLWKNVFKERVFLI